MRLPKVTALNLLILILFLARVTHSVVPQNVLWLKPTNQAMTNYLTIT